jgi:hypothetical protein
MTRHPPVRFEGHCLVCLDAMRVVSVRGLRRRRAHRCRTRRPVRDRQPRTDLPGVARHPPRVMTDDDDDARKPFGPAPVIKPTPSERYVRALLDSYPKCTVCGTPMVAGQRPTHLSCAPGYAPPHRFSTPKER